MGDKVGMDFPVELSLLQLPHVIWAQQSVKRALCQGCTATLPLLLSDTAHPCPSPPRRSDGGQDTFSPSQLLWQELQAPQKEDQTHKTNLLRGSMQVLARSHRAGTSTRPLAAGAQQIHRPGWEQAGGARAHAPPVPLAQAPELGASCSSRADTQTSSAPHLQLTGSEEHPWHPGHGTGMAGTAPSCSWI